MTLSIMMIAQTTISLLLITKGNIAPRMKHKWKGKAKGSSFYTKYLQEPPTVRNNIKADSLGFALVFTCIIFGK